MVSPLKEAAAQRVDGTEAVSRECPVGDRQSNGDIESGIRELKRQTRAVRMNLEQRLRQVLGEEDPLLTWIPTFAGDCIAFHRRARLLGKERLGASGAAPAWNLVRK